MKNQLLDDTYQAPKKRPKGKPNTTFATIIFSIGLVALFLHLGESESKVIQGSIYYIPLLSIGVLGYLLSPFRAIFIGVLILLVQLFFILV